jgi:hypothetical protein
VLRDRRSHPIGFDNTSVKINPKVSADRPAGFFKLARERGGAKSTLPGVWSMSALGQKRILRHPLTQSPDR